MSNRFLAVDDRPRESVPSGAGAKTAYAIAELMMLEECVRRCEMLAAGLAHLNLTHPMLAQLSECISACENYLAAKSRASDYEGRHAAFCREVLVSTASACRDLEDDAAIRCRMSCEIGIGFLEQSGPVHAEGWN